MQLHSIRIYVAMMQCGTFRAEQNAQNAINLAEHMLILRHVYSSIVCSIKTWKFAGGAKAVLLRETYSNRYVPKQSYTLSLF